MSGTTDTPTRLTTIGCCVCLMPFEPERKFTERELERYGNLSGAAYRALMRPPVNVGLPRQAHIECVGINTAQRIIDEAQRY